jgi:hypothetical protein
VTTFPSVLIACDCGFAAEGRPRATCEGARFWFGRCIGCGRELMARAPAANSPIPRGASGTAREASSRLRSGPAAFGDPDHRSRPAFPFALASADAPEAPVGAPSPGGAAAILPAVAPLGRALDRLGALSAWTTLVLAAALIALRPWG